MATQQVVPVACPNCRAKFNAPVENIIDGQNLALKYALLDGQLNVAQCPQCGFADMLTIPLLYFDLEKEIAFVLVPNSIQMTVPEQERIIGNLTNILMNTLPAEQRKFYLFNPKPFMSVETMAKAILQADGITEEMMAAQAAKTDLIKEFLSITDKEALKAKVKERDADLDRLFFEILTASIQASQMSGDMEGAQGLLGLRTLVSRWSSRGKQIVAEIDAEMQTVFIQSQEELLERLQTAQSDDEFAQLIVAGQPMLDYNFFQQLTSRIDEAVSQKNTQKANELTALRAKILEVKTRQEEVVQAALQKSAELLRKVVQSGAPDKILAENLDAIDEPFFMILSANIEEAKSQKRDDIVQALSFIGNLALKMLQQHEAEQVKGQQPPAQGKIHLA